MKTSSSFRTAVAFLAVLLAALGGGCASYAVKVDATRRPGPVNEKLTSFKIQSPDPAVDVDRLRYKELSEHIKTALSGHGLWEAPAIESADMIVEVSCGIEPPRIIFDEVDMPVFSRPGERPANEGRVAPSNPSPHEAKDILNYDYVAVPVIVREKHLSVSCHENKKAAEGTPPTDLWRVSVSIEDEGADLRRYLPVLAAAMMEQIGRNTDGVVTDTMSKKDDAIGFIKKGI